jgi:zinc transport system substrate-binding protein
MLLLTLLCIGGCGGDKGAAKKEETPKLKIVTTIFPEYSWVKEMLGTQGQHAELMMLAKKGVDMHSYQPSAEDILKIAGCDLFIYVGGESDKWVDKALQEGKNPKRKVINLMKLLGNRVREEETVEGMEKDDHHDHHDKDKHNDNHEHQKDDKHRHDEVEYDEHVWLSLKNADLACKAIADELAALDPKNAASYGANYDAYSKKLAALDGQYKEAVAKANVKTVLFGDRFPFRYLTDDYGLKYYAAFRGCSAETEASFETVAFLSKKMDELNLPAILTIEGRQHKLARTIVDNTRAKNRKILTLHSMQSVSDEEIKKGADYLKVMEENLMVLKEALAK